VAILKEFLCEESNNLNNQLCIVTFLRGGEEFTKPFQNLINTLVAEFSDQVRCVMFVEHIVSIPDGVMISVEQIVKTGTKYQKILYLLEEDKTEYLLCVDNDVTNNPLQIIRFVRHMLTEKMDAGWGKIMAEKPVALVAGMVAVDKVLSHHLVRPLLWQIRWGITVPGQCFMLRRQSFVGKLLPVDTYLDDLALGLYIRANYRQLKVHYSNEILGFEKPNNTWRGLWQQRERWAKGYASVCCGAWSTSYFPYVVVHGLAYHASWALHWLVIVSLGLVSPGLAVIYLLVVTVALTAGNMNMLSAAALYQVAFPVLHGWWLWCLVKVLAKAQIIGVRKATI